MLGGRGVRLREGRYDQVVDAGDPVELAGRFAVTGVRRLHVVDLEGARAGEPLQAEVLRDVLAAARAVAPSIVVQAAGGLRSEASVERVLGLGADAAVLGTAAIEDPAFLGACAARWPGRIHASVDVRDGRVALDGWERELRLDALDVGARLLDEGAAGLVITDTRRDGTLGGPNLELLGSFRERFPASRVVAAGGVRSIDDLLALAAIGIDGAIAGMALVAGSLLIEAALAALDAVARDAEISRSARPRTSPVAR